MHTSFFLHFGIFDSIYMLSLFLFFLSWVYFARLTCLVHRGTVPSCGERSPGRWHTENILVNVGKARSFLWKWARQSHGRRSGPLLLLFWSTQALLHSLSPCSHLYKRDKIICEWMHTTSRTERGERERERERERQRERETERDRQRERERERERERVPHQCMKVTMRSLQAVDLHVTMVMYMSPWCYTPKHKVWRFNPSLSVSLTLCWSNQ